MQKRHSKVLSAKVHHRKVERPVKFELTDQRIGALKGVRKRVRLNADFASGLRLFWVVQPFAKKYLACAVGQITGFQLRRPALHRATVLK